MVDVPKTIAEINKLTNDKVQESLHLEYKDSRAAAPDHSNEISKAISAFANSDGGVIIYGVQEDKKHFPIMIDIGIDHSIFSHERLEQIIHGNITPRVDDLRIYPIPLSIDRSIYVVQIPKSYRGPHQAADKKYYKRFNFLATAMEEITKLTT
jgi:predicted HTH transcriptional regulator